MIRAGQYTYTAWDRTEVNHCVEAPGANSHVKGAGVLVVSLRGVNYGIWYPLGYGQWF